MILNADERNQIVTYRFEKAQTALLHAEKNASLGFWEVAANRLYYASYYAVSALLIASGHSAQTHNGVIQQFGMFFIKTNLIDRSYGKLYNRLFTLRLTGDYSDSYNLDKDDVEPLIEPTREMINVISNTAKTYKS